MSKMTKRKKGKTYTKKVTRNMLIISTIGGFMPYVLSFFNKEPVMSLGEVWVAGIVSICIGYFVRGYKDSKSMAEMELQLDELEKFGKSIMESEENI